MTKLNQIYKCNICSNVIEILHTGDGELVCCNEPMKLFQEKTKKQEGEEKHVPVVQNNKVKIGSKPHPMDPDHYIEWIEIIMNNKVGRKSLKPGDQPEVQFCAQAKKARAYCNIHGLWIN